MIHNSQTEPIIRKVLGGGGGGGVFSTGMNFFRPSPCAGCFCGETLKVFFFALLFAGFFLSVSFAGIFLFPSSTLF